MRHLRRIDVDDTEPIIRRPDMFNIDHLLRVATAGLGAILLTTVALAAAVGPAEAVGRGEIGYAAARTVIAHG